MLDSGAEGPGFKSQPPLPLQCFTSVISRSHKVLDVQSHTELISSKVLQTPQTFHCIYQRFTDENCNLDPTRPTIACPIIFAHRSSVVTSCCSILTTKGCMAAATYRITLDRAGYFLYVTTGREMPQNCQLMTIICPKNSMAVTISVLPVTPLSAVYNKISYNVLIILYCQL